MPNNLEKSCAFTGHRPTKFPWKYDEKDECCTELKAVLAQQIKNLVARGMTDFYTKMALGTDTWAATIILALRESNPTLKLCCVLPCEGQEITWAIPAHVRYKHILHEADSVEYVKRFYDQKCMLEHNQRLVNSSAILLAVYNGEKRGGTAATIRYAQKAGREIVVIDPLSRRITYENRMQNKTL